MRAFIWRLFTKLRAFRWTWRRSLATAFVAWIVLLVAFAKGRVCEPLFSAKCTRHFWDSIGDAVWLVHWGQWQTLIAGLIAIAAAFVGGAFINKQIQQTEILERDRRSREFAAARAMLPIYLSNLAQYMQDCAKGLKALYRLRKVDPSPAQAFDVPEFPPAPLEAAHFLQSVILTSPAQFRKPFVDILQELQTFDARLRMMRGRYTTAAQAKQATRSGLLDITIQAIELYALIESMFPFSRDESDDVPTEPMIAGRYTTAMSILDFDGENAPELLKAVAQRVVRAHERATKTTD